MSLQESNDALKKTCTKCGNSLPLDCFNKTSARDGGKPKSICKSCCNRIYYRRFIQNHPEKAQEHNRNRDIRRRQDLPRYHRYLDQQRSRKYGISISDQHQLLIQQGYACFLCNKVGDARTLHLDHDHTTGLVRGFLCPSCNYKLSYIEHNPFFQRVLLYIDSSRRK